VLAAAQEDVAHLGLFLEDAAHQGGQVRIELNDLLKFVEDQRDAPLTLAGDAGWQFEELLEGEVGIGGVVGHVEAEVKRNASRSG